MAQIPVEQLKPGMEVAEDVLNVNGMLLLAGGATLNEQSIRVLKMWGVKVLKVAGGDDQVPEEAVIEAPEGDALREAQKALALRFKHVQDEMRVARALKHLACERLARKLAEANRGQPT